MTVPASHVDCSRARTLERFILWIIVRVPYQDVHRATCCWSWHRTAAEPNEVYAHQISSSLWNALGNSVSLCRLRRKRNQNIVAKASPRSMRVVNLLIPLLLALGTDGEIQLCVVIV